jgi:Cys-tRNA(Pro)/Cys-tRNA(Cys) deacylase
LAGKTNAVRVLEAAGADFTLHSFPVDEEHLDAVSVAHVLGVTAERVFKTLVTVDREDNAFVFCIPGNATLDLRKAAATAGVRRLEMLPLKRLKPLTGYIHGACSPFAMTSALPITIDEVVTIFDTVFVSAGERGRQIELSPDTLVELTTADIADLTR